MSDFFEAAIIANIPAEAVTAIRKISRERSRCKGQLQPFCADQFGRVERLIPLIKIGNRGINAAIAQHGTGQALVSARETLPGSRVTISAIGNDREAVLVSERVIHFERLENIFL